MLGLQYLHQLCRNDDSTHNPTRLAGLKLEPKGTVVRALLEGVNLGSAGYMRLQLRPTSVLRMRRRRNWNLEHGQGEEHRKSALRTWKTVSCHQVKESNSGAGD